MDDLVDQTDYVVDATSDGVKLLVFDQLASEIDLTAPQVNLAPPPLWEWETVPSISALAREIAERLHPGEGVTGWLYSQRELAIYEAQQERLKGAVEQTG